MGYTEAFTAFQSTFLEAIVIAHPREIKQNGVYLLYDGSQALNTVEDRLSFTLACAANSYMGENSLMGVVDDLRQRVLACSFDIEWEKTRSVSFPGGLLYVVAVELSIDVNMKGRL